MLWHLRAMWDALFDWPIWASLFGFWGVAILIFWLGPPWFASAGIVMAVNGIWVPIFAWWSAYGLICKYRPIGEHYAKIENEFGTYTYQDYE